MIRVSTIAPDGQGYDLTAEVDGLNWSSVRKGGDESCAFTVRRSWLPSNPALAKGSLLRVSEGLEVLWQGRIEEHDPTAGDAEEIGITAYGLGARLKDLSFRMIFIDDDLEKWAEPSRARQIILTGANVPQRGGPEVISDTADALPSLRLNLEAPIRNAVPVIARCEAWYDAGEGLLLSALRVKGTADTTNANFFFEAHAVNNDGSSAVFETGMGDAFAGAAFEKDYQPANARRYMMVYWNNSVDTGVAPAQFAVYLSQLRVYGDHGLSPVGALGTGFTAGQIVAWCLSAVSGVTGRVIESGTIEQTQIAFDTPTTYEDAIVEVDEVEGFNWGTWGPASALDTSREGYFDYRAPRASEWAWELSRKDTDDLDLHDELGSLFDTVDVSYTDASGQEHIERRTRTIAALERAGLSGRSTELDGGTLTQAAAQALGEKFFDLQGGEAPSRGSLTISGPAKHTDRGYLPAHLMRADGSNIKVWDVLPYTDAISLAEVDSRTVFPVERVSVDASSWPPSVTVDLDQASDRISVLQARLEEAMDANDGGRGPAAAVGRKKKKKRKKKKRKNAGKGAE